MTLTQRVKQYPEFANLLRTEKEIEMRLESILIMLRAMREKKNEKPYYRIG